MASQAQIDRLIGRALFDVDFRKLLLADPEKAARTLRYRLDGAQAARIRSLDPAKLEQLGAAFASAITPPSSYNSLSFW